MLEGVQVDLSIIEGWVGQGIVGKLDQFDDDALFLEDGGDVFPLLIVFADDADLDDGRFGQGGDGGDAQDEGEGQGQGQDLFHDDFSFYFVNGLSF